jgi:tRNA 2-thiouridine synthesizing protein B
MAMLHLIRNSGFNSNALTQCLEMILPQDSILLIDDGCYNLSHALLVS